MSQYIFVAGKQDLTWTESEAAAQLQGGHLVSVNTGAEDAFIRGVLARYDSLWSGEPRDQARNGPWIGLTQAPGSSEPGGGWIWLDGTPATFNGWHSGQPDNFIGDNHALYWDNDGSIGWADHIDDPVSAGYGGVQSYAVELSDRTRLLFGSNSQDIIYGGDVNNVVRGRGGADVLDGGGGQDVLYGGGGRDRFVFATADQADGDRIMDIVANERIDLSAIDANEVRDGNQIFRLAAAFTGRAGQLVVAFDGTNSTIAGDTDGDGLADFTIHANGDLTAFAGFQF